MPSYSSATWAGFAAELQDLQKLAGPGVLPGLARRALSAGSASALGGAAGGALGAGVGAYKGYNEAKAQGGSGIGGALRGALSTGMQGAIGGAAVGAIGGAAAGQRGADFAKSLATKDNTLGVISRFGQRQVHAVTGALPEGFATRGAAVRSIGAGSASALKDLQAVRAKLPTATGAEHAGLLADQSRLMTTVRGARAAEEAGFTSIPGMFRSMASPRQFASGAAGAAKQQWHGAKGVVGKASLVGLPLGMAASEAASPDGDAGSVAGSLGESLPYAMLPMATAGTMLLGSGLSAAGKRLGRRREPAMVRPEDSEGLAAPPERVESPSMQSYYPQGTMT